MVPQEGSERKLVNAANAVLLICGDREPQSWMWCYIRSHLFCWESDLAHENDGGLTRSQLAKRQKEFATAVETIRSHAQIPEVRTRLDLDQPVPFHRTGILEELDSRARHLQVCREREAWMGKNGKAKPGPGKALGPGVCSMQEFIAVVVLVAMEVCQEREVSPNDQSARTAAELLWIAIGGAQAGSAHDGYARWRSHLNKAKEDKLGYREFMRSRLGSYRYLVQLAEAA